jgi:hypothetical protein
MTHLRAKGNVEFDALNKEWIVTSIVGRQTP